MATRMHAREAVLQLLYAKDLGNDKVLEQAALFFHDKRIRNKQQEFAMSLLNGVCDNEIFIVCIMNIFLEKWDINRLGIIEKNILKLGIYELLKTDTHKAVIINEAIELANSFGVHEAFGLINGVLDSIAKKDIKELTDMVKEYKENMQKVQSGKKDSNTSNKKRFPKKRNVKTKQKNKRNNNETMRGS